MVYGAPELSVEEAGDCDLRYLENIVGHKLISKQHIQTLCREIEVDQNPHTFW